MNVTSPTYYYLNPVFPEAETLTPSTIDDIRSNPWNEAPILAACRDGNANWLQKLLESDPQLATQSALSGVANIQVYPLYLAAQEGHPNVVELLLGSYLKTLPEAEKARGIVTMQNTASLNRFTPLYLAAQKGHTRVVELLLECLNTLPESGKAHAIMKVVNAATQNGATPLLVAAQKGHTRVVELLLECLKTLPESGKAHAIMKVVNAAKQNGSTPLLVATQKGHTRVLELLLECLNTLPESEKALGIATVVNAALPDGATPLFMAAEKGHTKIVKLLLENGAVPDVRCYDFKLVRRFRILSLLSPLLSSTPFQTALLFGNFKTAKLIHNSIQSRKVAEVTERTPLLR